MADLSSGLRFLFVPGLLACHGAAFACMQLAFQRGSRLTTAGLAVLWTNALPYVMTIVVLVVVSSGTARSRLGAPAALGNAYAREDR